LQRPLKHFHQPRLTRPVKQIGNDDQQQQFHNNLPFISVG
jgi:hypothetical protein